MVDAPMIKVVVEGPATGTGFVPYRVDWFVQGRPQIKGLSQEPLLDACRQLKRMGLMDSTVVGLFSEGSDTWRMRTTVGYGAAHTVQETPNGPKFKPYRPHPGKGIYGATASGIDYSERAATPIAGEDQPSEATDEIQAILEAPLRPPRKLPKQPVHKGLGLAKPDKPKKSHPKRPRTKSGGRRGYGSRR